MKIQIDQHTRVRAAERGVTDKEIEETILTGVSMPAALGRLARHRVFEFNSVWNGRYYAQKRVEVVYVVENGVIITITVYSMYGQWRSDL